MKTSCHLDRNTAQPLELGAMRIYPNLYEKYTKSGYHDCHSEVYELIHNLKLDTVLLKKGTCPDYVIFDDKVFTLNAFKVTTQGKTMQNVFDAIENYLDENPELNTQLCAMSVESLITKVLANDTLLINEFLTAYYANSLSGNALYFARLYPLLTGLGGDQLMVKDGFQHVVETMAKQCGSNVTLMPETQVVSIKHISDKRTRVIMVSEDYKGNKETRMVNCTATILTGVDVGHDSLLQGHGMVHPKRLDLYTKMAPGCGQERLKVFIEYASKDAWWTSPSSKVALTGCRCASNDPHLEQVICLSDTSLLIQLTGDNAKNMMSDFRKNQMRARKNLFTKLHQIYSKIIPGLESVAVHNYRDFEYVFWCDVSRQLPLGGDISELREITDGMKDRS